MSKKRVYAAIEIADQEIRLIVLEIFETKIEDSLFKFNNEKRAGTSLPF